MSEIQKWVHENRFLRNHLWSVLIITLVSILLMLPRILSAQYGLLDDGVTFWAGEEMAAGTWELDWKAGSGRFRPMYWIFNAALVMLFPENAAGAFSGNALILIASNILIYWIVFKLFGDRMSALFSALFFLFSGPIIETFYTVSKAEHFQVVCILFSIFWVMKAAEASQRWKQASGYFVSFIFITAGMLTKETSIVMVPMTLGWMGIAWVLKRWDPDFGKQVLPRLVYAGITITAAAVFLVARMSVMGLSSAQDSYAGKVEISVDRIVDSTVRMAGWMIRDFPQLFPWILAFLILWMIRKNEISIIRKLSDVILWMLGWIGVFLPWGSTQEYYLLPFAVGAAVLSGVLLREIISALSQLPLSTRRIISLLTASAMPFLVVTLLHNYTSARIQLIVDQENSKMLQFLAEEVPENGYVFHAFPEGIEYSGEIRLHLEKLLDRQDIVLAGFKFQTASRLNVPVLEYYVPSSTIKNQVKLSVRVGVGESMNDSRAGLIEFTNGREDKVYSSHDSFRIFHFDIFLLACPIFPDKAYCSGDDPVLDRRMFEYGWDVDRVNSEAEMQVSPGAFHDGVWALVGVDGSIDQFEFGMQGDIPLPGDYNGDSHTDAAVLRPDSSIIYYDYDFDGISDYSEPVQSLYDQSILVAGDWDGDGKDVVAVFQVEESYLTDLGGNVIEAVSIPTVVLEYGSPVPVSGDWDGNRVDEIALYYPGTGKFDTGWTVFEVPVEGYVVSGDWAGYGKDSIAAVENETWRWHYILMDCPGCNEPELSVYENLDGVPVGGRWRQ